MDDRLIDRVAKALGRRRTRRLLVGTGVLLGADRRAVPVAETAGGSTCREMEPGQIISKNACTATACGTTEGCVCVQTPGHVVRCAARFDPKTDCPKTDECGDGRPCGRGRFCAKVAKCCDDRPRRICLRPCPA